MIYAIVTFFIVIIIVTVGHTHSKETREVYVNTALGRIRGEVVANLPLDGTVTTIFRGIPYAKPPVGPHRFASPQPAAAWPGTLNATKYRPTCSLNVKSTGKKSESLEGRVSEDCLYVDVYIPRDGSTGMPMSLPIMVHLHGFSSDTERCSLAPGVLGKLAHAGDVIVVHVNSRTGVIGFASTADAVLPGNNGLRDQTFALKWVKENIRNFGGNPGLVTIFGTGEGAVAVSHHLLSPVSQGLFRRAISHGGVALNPQLMNRHPLDTIRKCAEVLKCHTNSSSDMVRCLRGVPAAKLLTALPPLERRWLPVIDGQFIRSDPQDLLHDPAISRYDYMIGTDRSETDDQLAKLLQQQHHQQHQQQHQQQQQQQQKQQQQNQPELSDTLVTDIIQNRIKSDSVRNYKQNFVQVASLVKMEYSDGCTAGSTTGQKTRRDMLREFLSDHGVFAPAELMARLYSAHGARIYLYDHRPTVGEHVDARPPTPYSHHETRSLNVLMRKEVIRGWTNFARIGNPNQLNHNKFLYWKLYSQSQQHYMEFSANVTARVGFHPRRMAFWNDYLPHLQGKRPCVSATVTSPVVEEIPHTQVSDISTEAEVTGIYPSQLASRRVSEDNVHILYIISAVLGILLVCTTAFLAFTIWKLHHVKKCRKISEKDLACKEALDQSDTINQTQPLNQTCPLNHTDAHLIS